jgi:ferrochelatase
MTNPAVFLMGFGGPESPDRVRPFVERVLHGRPVPPDRVDAIVAHYEKIGGKSPYSAAGAALAERLAAQLAADGPAWPVYVGYRYCPPSFLQTLGRMADDGVTDAAGLILSPLRSMPGWDVYLQELEIARRTLGPRAPRVRTGPPAAEEDGFIMAVADRARTATRAIPSASRTEALWLFTAHSIPAAPGRSDEYADQLRRAARLTALRAGHALWEIAFQSRSGVPQESWLEPDIGDALTNAARRGVRDVLVIPLGFLMDHAEVLYDLDIKAAAKARELGIGFHRAPTVGDHPAFIGLLADHSRHALADYSIREAP